MKDIQIILFLFALHGYSQNANDDGIMLQNGCPSDYPERYPGTNRCFGFIWGNFGCNIDPENDPARHHALDRRCVYSEEKYIVASSQMTLPNARAYCHSRSRFLAKPQNEVDRDSIRALLPSGNVRAWLGIYQQNDMTWRRDDGESMGWTNWKSGEGNDRRGENAGAAMVWQSGWTGHWYDMPNNDGRLHYVVCEQPSSSAGQNFGGKQQGFCVHTNGADQTTGVIKANPAISEEGMCLTWCENYETYLTGCEFIYGPQTDWGCYGHTYEVARANGANFHTCWIKNETPTLGTRQNGYCVKNNGHDQNSNVVRSSDWYANLFFRSCKDWCETQTGITGCEFIWGQANFGCYAHNSAVTHGNGVGQHYCWIANRRNLEGRRSLAFNENSQIVKGNRKE